MGGHGLGVPVVLKVVDHTDVDLEEKEIPGGVGHVVDTLCTVNG